MCGVRPALDRAHGALYSVTAVLSDRAHGALYSVCGVALCYTTLQRPTTLLCCFTS